MGGGKRKSGDVEAVPPYIGRTTELLIIVTTPVFGSKRHTDNPAPLSSAAGTHL